MEREDVKTDVKETKAGKVAREQQGSHQQGHSRRRRKSRRCTSVLVSRDLRVSRRCFANIRPSKQGAKSDLTDS